MGEKPCFSEVFWCEELVQCAADCKSASVVEKLLLHATLCLCNFEHKIEDAIAVG